MSDHVSRWGLVGTVLWVCVMAVSLSCSGGEEELQGDSGAVGVLDAFDAIQEIDSSEVASLTPSDDPADYDVDTSVEYEPIVANLRWVVPSDALPEGVELQVANNNLDIIFFEDRLFLAFLTGIAHFADANVKMYIVSSLDDGATWDLERTIDIDTDIREPRLLAVNGSLQMLFFEAGTEPFKFEPKRMWKTRRMDTGEWSDLEVVTEEPVIPWDVKTRGGQAFMTSYQGNHYEVEALPEIEVYFESSTDGEIWERIEDVPFVYKGGVSEVAFEFDSDGSLWAVTRNEDGDSAGFGSQVCFAPAEHLGNWDCGTSCDPERYDSPELFRHGDDIYLAARRDVGGPYDEGLSDLSYEEQKGKYLMDYSLRPKRFALYKIDKTQRKVVHVMDLPGVGDTAFAAVRRTGPHTFLLANYTSPLDKEEYTWLEGQVAPEGTQIYFLDIEFKPKGADR